VSPKLSGFEARQADNVQLLRPGRDRHRDLDLALTDVLPAAGFTANEVLALVAVDEDSLATRRPRGVTGYLVPARVASDPRQATPMLVRLPRLRRGVVAVQFVLNPVAG